MERGTFQSDQPDSVLIDNYYVLNASKKTIGSLGCTYIFEPVYNSRLTMYKVAKSSQAFDCITSEIQVSKQRSRTNTMAIKGYRYMAMKGYRSI